MVIPESPRWLVKAGRHEEAFDIIVKLRGNDVPDHPEALREYQEILEVVGMEQESPSTNYLKMFFGTGSGDVHLGRRI